MTPMNPTIKAEWVAALRSGEYQQGTGTLSMDGEFCCLGVLTDIAVEHGVCSWVSTEDGLGVNRSGATETSVLPPVVMAWAGLASANPEIDLTNTAISEPDQHDLAHLNDDGITFAQIADLIEEQL